MPDELVVIGCRHRTGTNKVFLDGDRHHSRWRWTHFGHDTLLLCRGVRERLSFVLIWLARPKILDDSKHDILSRNGTNDHEQPRSVPSGSTRSNRVNARPLSTNRNSLVGICSTKCPNFSQNASFSSALGLASVGAYRQQLG